ncbi:UNVERIFIED_CONTAM: Exocyst complex component EXO70A1 [Sesamum radiatum]|uniref:Exocyst subunit Exo70 family protein n=1 Tax=Sesamum radiatum TaxID=300843 RepID=A0AAW2NMZ7_SESRA
MAAYAGTIETLTERAALMRESMQKTQAITDNMAAILGSFDHRLSALETAMRPTQALLFFRLLYAEAKLLRGPHEDLESYLEAVDQLRSIVRFFSGKKGIKSSIGVVNHANNLIAKATTKLEEELRQLLALYSLMFAIKLKVVVVEVVYLALIKPVEPDRLFDCLPNSMRPSSGSPRDGESNGKKASEQQNKENGSRSSALEQTLRKLGVERLGKEDVQKMQWEVLEAKIGNWIHYMRIAVKLLFAGEKKIDIIFGSKFCVEMRESSVNLTKRLAQTAQETFGDFEEAVEKDATKTAVLDGTVHPLTSYVINYVKFLFDYHSTLQQLFREFDDGDAEKHLASITTRIMQALQSNLDGKSKQYKDPALTQLFLMNNVHYIVRSVRRSEAKDLLGDDWVQIHRRVVQQHANQYKRIAWSKANGVKDRFKNFNLLFEEIHQRQSQWTVPDSELRESLRLAVAEVLLPAYRSFIRRFGPMIEGGKNPQKYIRYTPEDLERMLAEFFEGKTWNEPRR